MYHSDVYNIMIGAPSDIKEEVNTAITVINRWNYINSKSTNIALIPLHWTFSSYPTSIAPPQKSINKQLVDRSDLMIAIFGTKIGTPTDTEISGTVEEINEHLKVGNDVMIFFKSSSENIYSIDPKQLQKINEFKNGIKNRVLWCDFTNNDDFCQKLYDKIQLYINDHWKNAQQVFTSDIIAERRQPKLSEEEKQRLKDWTSSRSEVTCSFSSMGGYLYVIGNKQYQVNKGRENAEWEDFFKRLQNADFIEFEKYNKEGRPIYKLLKAAYDYVDGLESEP